MKHTTQVLATVALLMILLTLAATAGGIYARFQQTNANRRANSQIWHAVICDIERQVVSDRQSTESKLTKVQKVAFLREYDRLLVQDAHAAPCNLTHVVTGR